MRNDVLFINVINGLVGKNFNIVVVPGYYLVWYNNRT